MSFAAILWTCIGAFVLGLVIGRWSHWWHLDDEESVQMKADRIRRRMENDPWYRAGRDSVQV